MRTDMRADKIADMHAYPFIDICTDMRTDMFTGTREDMCREELCMCMDISVDMPKDKCTDKGTGMCADVCMNMGTDWCTERCTRHVYKCV